MSQELKTSENKVQNSTNSHDHETVTIHIGKNTYKSPNPTTGAALYVLGNVDVEQYDLFREVHGKGDDELISNDESIVHLKEGDHFYTAQKSLNPGA